MTQADMITDTYPAGYHLAPKAYLRAVVAVGRSAARDEYLVVHFGSGSLFRTDHLGAFVVQSLINGWSGAQIMELVEFNEKGAGERARALIYALGSTGAMTLVRPETDRNWPLRRAISKAMGLALTVLGQVVRGLPARILAWAFRNWPSTPFVGHIWRSSRPTILGNLTASGYAGETEAWLLNVGRRCVAEPSRNHLFSYVAIAIPRARLNSLVDSLFEEDSVNALAETLTAAGPTICTFLHGPLCAAVPNALRSRGHELVRVIVTRTHGVNVSKHSGALGDFFGDPPGSAVDEADPNASGALLRHLNAGRNVYIALDIAARSNSKAVGPKMAEINMLGHRTARNDGPAWLAVRSGRPVALWSTYTSPHGVVIISTPPIYPNPLLPVELRIAAVSERLYEYAEAAIREHPEAWTCWTYPALPGVDALSTVSTPSTASG